MPETPADSTLDDICLSRMHTREWDAEPPTRDHDCVLNADDPHIWHKCMCGVEWSASALRG